MTSKKIREFIKVRKCEMIVTVATVIVVSLLVLLFVIFDNRRAEYNIYIAKFKTECEKSGGIMHINRFYREVPKPECRNPAMIINIEINKGE